MPTLSFFYGIYIMIYFEDHAPPHFHAKYNNFKARFTIDPLGILSGKMPPKAIALIMEWASIHQQELIDNWNSIQNDGIFTKIDPLQ